MEVTLTVEDTEGGIGHVTALGADYEDAYAKAVALIPDGCKAIAIRVN
ncbi:hypothetical protein [Paenarthrobacter nicotinovorans]|nr:hypothetical protein [Paenarthrobacter nicotinovorans]